MTATLTNSTATYISAEQAARNDYARWFVREHFLPKDYTTWVTGSGEHGYIGDLLAHWKQILIDGRIQYHKFDQGGYDNFMSDLHAQVMSGSSMSRGAGGYSHAINSARAAYNQLWWVELVDIDLVMNDDNAHVKKARAARQATQDNQYWLWLIAEAEYMRVYHEALVRSYGVDVKAP